MKSMGGRLGCEVETLTRLRVVERATCGDDKDEPGRDCQTKTGGGKPDAK